MSKAVVVFDTTAADVVNHRRTGRPITARQVVDTESLQQQFGLVEPRRIHRSEQHSDSRRQLAQYGAGRRTHVAGAFIQNEMDLLGPAIRMQEAPQRRLKVGTIIPVQALGPHVPIVDVQACQQIERAMPDILKLLPLNLPALAAGKKYAADQNEWHRTRPLAIRPDRSAHTPARSSPDPAQLWRRLAPHARRSRGPKEFGRAGPRVVACDHPAGGFGVP